MNTEKLKQAAQEFVWTFGAVFAISFLGWVTGWTNLPNLEAAKAALKAATIAAAGASAKAVLWYATGTQKDA